MRRTSWISRGVGVIGVLFVIMSCGQGKMADENNLVRVGYSPFAVNLPFFVALDRGYFKDEGIEVEATEMPSADAHTIALIAGRIDASVSMPTLTALRAAEEADGHSPFKIILFNWLTRVDSPDGFVVRAQDSLSGPEGLSGTRIATVPDLTWKAFLDVILDEATGSRSRFSIIDLAPVNHLDAVASGQVSSAFTIEPILATAELRGDLAVVGRGAMARYIRDPLIAGGFTLSSEVIEKRPAVAVAYRRALLRGVEDIEKDPVTARLVLTRFLPLSADVAGDVRLNRYVTPSEGNLDELVGTIRVYRELNLVGSEPDAMGLIWWKTD